MHQYKIKVSDTKKNLYTTNRLVFNWYFFVQCLFFLAELVCVKSTKNNVKAVVVEVISVVVELEAVIIVGIEVLVDLANGLVLFRTFNSRDCSNK